MSLGHIKETTTNQLRTVVEEVTQVKTTLLEQNKVLPRLAEHLEDSREHEVSHEGQRSPLPSPIRRLPRTNITVRTSTEPSLDASVTTAFDKGAFVRSCLIENPHIRNTDIQRKAVERGQTISPGYISDVRKAFFAEQSFPSSSSVSIHLEATEGG